MANEKPSIMDRLVYYTRYLVAKTERPWLLYVRQVLWVLLSGWILFIYYLLAAVSIVCTIIFIPFAWPTLKLAFYALMPIQRELYVRPVEARTNFFHHPFHPFTAVANVLWCIFFGWNFFIMHVILGIVQFITIIGIGNGLINFQLALLALWPFGRDIRSKPPADFPPPLYQSAGDLERQRYSVASLERQEQSQEPKIERTFTADY